jgi:2-phosphosulfolactate phosphatase
MQKLNENVELSDSSLAGLVLNKTFGKNLKKLLKETEHGKVLIENGFAEDIKFCAQYGTTELVPYFISSSIKKLETTSTHTEQEQDLNK